MKIEKIMTDEANIAVVSSEERIIVDTNSALDLIMTVQYETGADRIVIDKDAVSEEFFILSTGIAGEILQKFMNYRIKAAIFGDYSKYTSKPLKILFMKVTMAKTSFSWQRGKKPLTG